MADNVILFNDKEWRIFLKKIKFNLNNALPKLKVLSSAIGLRNIKEHFEKEESPQGKWKRRSKKTQLLYAIKSRRKKKYNPTNKLLQLTGKLRKSLLPYKKRNVKLIRKVGILLFTNVEYAATHNYGKGKIPRRQFMWLSDNTKQKIINSLARWIIKK